MVLLARAAEKVARRQALDLWPVRVARLHSPVSTCRCCGGLEQEIGCIIGLIVEARLVSRQPPIDQLLAQGIDPFLLLIVPRADAYNFETLKLQNNRLEDFLGILKRVRCAEGRSINGHDCSDVRGEVVHLSLSDVTDPEIRTRLQAIRTGQTISPEDVALLVSVGEQLVQQDQQIRGLIAGLDEPAAKLATTESKRTHR